jgi:hypothetical protein
MFEPEYSLISNLVPYTPSEEEGLFIRQLISLMGSKGIFQGDAEPPMLSFAEMISNETLYLDGEGRGAKILAVLSNGLPLVSAEEWESCAILANKVASSMIQAYGQAASKTAKTLSDEEMDNVYRASLGQPVIFDRLRKEQIETVAREALAFAKAMNFKIIVASQIVTSQGAYSARQALSDHLLAMEEPSLGFVNEMTGGRPNKQAGLITITNAGSFLALYSVSLQIGKSYKDCDKLNVNALRETLIELGRVRINLMELQDQGIQAVQNQFDELAAYVRYISRTLARGEDLRETLEDLVRSDPETPLKTALSHILTHPVSLEAGLTRESEDSAAPYERELFEILLTHHTAQGSETTVEALNLFYERLIEARKEALAQVFARS